MGKICAICILTFSAKNGIMKGWGVKTGRAAGLRPDNYTIGVVVLSIVKLHKNKKVAIRQLLLC